tara:strand:- start:232 stop:543 length:312 start_codon:yes stop_codon:yes gene_type:complete
MGRFYGRYVNKNKNYDARVAKCMIKYIPYIWDYILVPKKLDTIDFRQHTQQETRQLLKKVLGYSDKEAKLLSFEIYNNQDNLVIKHTDLDKILAKAKKNINNI